MKYLLLVFLTFSLPLTVVGAAKPHIKTMDQDCAECHGNQEQVWLQGAHGVMGVKCVVCHGSPEKNFIPKPGPDRCMGCHAEQVVDVKKKLAAKDRSCFRCHEKHSVAVTDSAKGKAGFHRQGGAK